MIVVTTIEPSIMGGMFDEDGNAQSYARKLYEKYKDSNPAVNNNEFFPVYFDGELEELMEFDIVKHVAGEIPEIKDGDKIPMTAITLKGKEIDAVMSVFCEKSFMCIGMRKALRALIHTKEEKFSNRSLVEGLK